MKRPEKKPPARLDQVNTGIRVSPYHLSAASSPLMLTQSGQGSAACTARLRLGLLATKGVSPFSLA